MPSGVELWVSDQLHEILGLSEKVIHCFVTCCNCLKLHDVHYLFD